MLWRESIASCVAIREECYAEDIKLCEDGGTPGILQAIRTGAAFEIKGSVDNDRIAKLEHKYFVLAMDSWIPNLNISLVGADRPCYQSYAPIFSFDIPSLVSFI